jgi:hypothetical protein
MCFLELPCSQGRGPHAPEALGRDHVPISLAVQPAPDDLLRAANGRESTAERIDVGRVDERDAALGRSVQNGKGHGLVTLETEGHRAETEVGYE